MTKIKSSPPALGFVFSILAVQQLEGYDYQRGEGFGNGDGEPEAQGADEAREEQESGNEENDAAEGGEENGKPRTLDALIVAHHVDVQPHEDDADGIVGKALGSQAPGSGVALEEDMHYGRRKKNEERRDDDAHHEAQTDAESHGLMHAPVGLGPMVETDDGLRRRRDGDIHHIYEREQVARHAVGRHPLGAQMAHEHQVARQHHHRHGKLAYQPRRSHTHHVAHIASHQPQALASPFQPVQPQLLGLEHHIVYHHNHCHQASDVGGQRRPHQAPAAGEDEEVVQHDVHHRRNHVGKHGIARRAVEADDEEAYILYHHQQAGGNKPHIVFAGRAVERAFGTQQPQDGVGEEVAEQAHQQRYRHSGQEHLGHVDARRLEVAMRKVDGCHHADAGAEHYAKTIDKHHDGANEVDGGKAVGAYAVAHEDAVGEDECHAEKHPQ